MPSLSPTSPAILQISVSGIIENYRTIRKLTRADVAPVLKADAYGLGAAQVFNALRKEGAERFFAATPDEGAQLRALDDTAAIFILGGFYKGADDAYLSGSLAPVLNSLEEIGRWNALCKKSGRKLPAAIHFDTGMNRLGLGKDETLTLIADSSLTANLDLQLILSHFACSDEKDHYMNAHQAAIFAKIAAHFPDVPKSLCNSSGIFHDPSWHYDMVRTGFALYGGNPTPEATNPMRRVVDLSVRILQTRCVKAGENAGYGASHTFQNDTTLATVALGYADGFYRAGSNRAKLFWNGQACPVVGRVSMDLVIVDIGGVKATLPQAGDLLEVLGPHQSVDDLAHDLGTIGYEILTSLGKRYARSHI